jgi:AcrR family transcriptional regulator
VVQSPPIPRAVRSARSREALCDAAFELFGVGGFDATTTEQITDRAGVSPRTFFRYFPTKASVVFHRDFGFMRSFATACVEQPLTLSDFEALRATFVELCAEVQPLRTRVEIYRNVIDSSPVLVGLEHQHLGEHAVTVAEAIVRRSNGAVAAADARTLADVSLALYQRALRRWLAGPPRNRLDDLVDDEFARLRTLAGARGSR